MGLSRAWRDAFDLLVEMLRPIAGIAWIPLALFILGIGNRLPVFIMFYSAFFPLLIGTAAGVRNVDARLLAAAATMGVTGRARIRHVVLPAALPAIMVSLRLAVAASWTAVVAAELVGAPSGLGYAIEYYRSMLATPTVMAFIVVIGLLGFVDRRRPPRARGPAHAVGQGRAAMTLLRRLALPVAAPRRLGGRRHALGLAAGAEALERSR